MIRIVTSCFKIFTWGLPTLSAIYSSAGGDSIVFAGAPIFESYFQLFKGVFGCNLLSPKC